MPIEFWGKKITVNALVSVDIYDISFSEKDREYVLSLKRKIEMLIKTMYTVTILIILSIVVHVIVR